MPQASRAKGPEVALVLGGGAGLGRAVALALAAKGTPVVVQGANEREVARVVGEITCGGGAARHIAGDLQQPGHLEAAIARAVETFGGLRYVVLTTADAGVASRAANAPGEGGRLVLAIDPPTPPSPRAQLTEQVADLAKRVESQGATANAVLWQDQGQDDPEQAADLVLYLCTQGAEGITGQVITVKGRGPA